MFPEAKLGIGPPITDGFYYDFDVPRAFTPEDLEALEKRMRQIVKEGQLFSRRVYESKDEAREELAERAVQARTRRRQVRRPRGDGGRRRRAHRLRQPQSPYPRTGMGRSVPRPAHPDDEVHSGVQADPQLGRVLAGRPEQRQPAAHLRHRVGVAGGARHAPRVDRGGAAPRSPQARRRAGPVQLPRRNRFGLGGFPPQGWHRPPRAGGLLAAQAHRGRLPVRQQPAHHQGAAVPDLRAPGLVRRRHVPADAPRRRVQRGRHGAQARAGLLPQADELPDALPDLTGHAGGPTANFRCGSSSSARSTATRCPAWCTV